MIQAGVVVQYDYGALKRKCLAMIDSRDKEIQALNEIIHLKEDAIKVLEAENKVLRQRKEKKIVKKKVHVAKLRKKRYQIRKGWVKPDETTSRVVEHQSGTDEQV